MSIKRFILIILCVSVLLSVSVFAAVDINDFAIATEDGSLQYDMDGYHYAMAVDMIRDAGLSLDASVYWIFDSNTGEYVGYDYDAFLADYEALTYVEPSLESSFDDLPDVDVVENESVFMGAYDETLLDNVLENPALYDLSEDVTEKTYNYIINDLRGVSENTALSKSDSFTFVYGETEPLWVSDDGMLYKITDVLPDLSTFPYIEFTATYSNLGETMIFGDLYPDYLPGNSSVYSLADFVFFVISFNCDYSGYTFPTPGVYCLSPEALSVIGGAFTSLSIKYPGCYLFDVPLTYSSGVKGVIERVFGTYSPVLEPVIYTEIIGDDVVINILDSVPSGAAGIDFTYISGVFLFGVMLFCLFRLLGGILS